MSDYRLLSGRPAPLGATPDAEGVNFALFSAHATGVDLCLFSPDGSEELSRIPLREQTGDVWHGYLEGAQEGLVYGYRVHGPYGPEDGHRFNANKLLLDPYAKSLVGTFGPTRPLLGYDPEDPKTDLSFCSIDSAKHMPKAVVHTPAFEWGNARPPARLLADSVIYEGHVRGLTMRHPLVPATMRGTFDALTEPAVLEHLTRLGVTALELLPVQAFFPEPRLTELGLTNYWGYNPISYFVPEPRYLSADGLGSVQKAVRALHDAGIEVILDVVYNHTGESWELGPTLSYRGIDNASYYRLNADNPRYYVNDTGTGNTLNCDHPAVTALVMDSLRYWVEVFHIDGFRFDLAATLGRRRSGFDPHAPLLAAMRQDPTLSRTKLIMEPWDVGPGGYQVGAFPAGWPEWNDQFRDRTRAFWRGDAGSRADMAGVLLGSADVYDRARRRPSDSVNFITSHDGFTLRDVVSYAHKHNEANLEENRDGHGHNISDNMGVEGATDDPTIVQRRVRRSRNMLATLMLAQGTPMLLAGDEIGHSQRGNNNAYCQDNDITWLDWDGANTDLADFVSSLIALRASNPLVRQGRYLHTRDEVVWRAEDGTELHGDAWHSGDQTLACHLKGNAFDLLILMNPAPQTVSFSLPEGDWVVKLNTAQADPFAVRAAGAGSLTVSEETVLLLEAQHGA